MQARVRAGDILLTRNAGGEEANPSPGYYNHSAIIAPMNWVIEAQAVPNAVIAVPIWDFFDRYPEILVLRCVNGEVAKRTADVAPKYLGRKYSICTTLQPLWLWKNEDNCVSLIRRIYNFATGVDYKWRIPDSLLVEEWLQHTALKKDYENYQTPNHSFSRMVTQWPNRPAEDYI